VRLLGRAVLFLFGLFLAIPAGLLVLSIGVAVEPAAQDLLAALGVAGLDAVWSDVWRDDVDALATEGFLVGLWTLSAALFVLPPTFVALTGEVLGIRSFVWYGFGCGALTAALPWLRRGSARLSDSTMLGAEGHITALLFVTGAVAGLTYWLVTGRTAGASSRRMRLNHHDAEPNTGPARRH
jgi:hypothetical protein